MGTVEPGEPEDPTEGGRWIVVDGRRWRATDPTIPDALRSELVTALMTARRAVGAARRNADEAAEKSARSHVNDAKVALGERGEPWWDPPSDEGLRQRARATVRTLIEGRAPDGTICPSDVARIIGGSTWRPLMPMIRSEVRDLALRNLVEVRQGGTAVDPHQEWTGPIRIGRPA